MQINHHYHAEHFRSLARHARPAPKCRLRRAFPVTPEARHDTWSMAVARYHAGPDNDPAQKQYVCRVIANMVATGFGKWTPTPARSATSRLHGRRHLLGRLRVAPGLSRQPITSVQARDSDSQETSHKK